jgi:Ca2+-binding EF-hand superfamily protein/NAD-dependent SIR2 family protein deacetylase
LWSDAFGGRVCALVELTQWKQKKKKKKKKRILPQSELVSDNNGSVSRGELYAHMRSSKKLREVAGEALREMSDLEVFHALDSDKDGVITWAEFEERAGRLIGSADESVEVRAVPAPSPETAAPAPAAKAVGGSRSGSGKGSATSGKLTAKERRELQEQEQREAEAKQAADDRARAKATAIDRALKRTERFKRLFQELDNNDDGVISTLEFVRGVKHDPELLALFTDAKSLDREVAIFNQLDVDGSGALSWEEFLSACEQLEKLRAAGQDNRVAALSAAFHERRKHFQDVFRSVDVNSDGSVSILEFGHAIDNHPALGDVMKRQSVVALARTESGLFDLIDRDQDGRISWNEFDAALSVLGPPAKSKPAAAAAAAAGSSKSKAKPATAAGGKRPAAKTGAATGATKTKTTAAAAAAKPPAAKAPAKKSTKNLTAAERKKRKKKGEMDDMNEYERAALTIMNADMMLLVLGSGFAKDSGIPLYPEVSRMPQYRALGLNANDLTDFTLIETQPNLAYGFWGHMYNTCRENPPHQGYDIAHFWKQKLFTGPEAEKRIKPENLDEAIKALKLRRTDDTGGPAKKKVRPPFYKLPFFCLTTCWDGHLYKSGFDPREVSDVHGCITGWQCSKRCTDNVWNLGDDFVFEVDMQRMWAPLFKTLTADDMRDIAIREEEEDRAAEESDRARGGSHGADCGCSEHARLHALPYKPPRLTQFEVSKYRPDNHLWIQPQDDEHRALTAASGISRGTAAAAATGAGAGAGGPSSAYRQNSSSSQQQQQQQQRRPRSAATPEVMLDALSADFDASVRFAATSTPRGEHDDIEAARENPRVLHHLPAAEFTDHGGRTSAMGSGIGRLLDADGGVIEVRGNLNPPAPPNAHFSGTFAFRDGDYYMRREDVRKLHEGAGVSGVGGGDGGDSDVDSDRGGSDTGGASGAGGDGAGDGGDRDRHGDDDGNGGGGGGDAAAARAAQGLDPALRESIAQRMGYVPKSVTLLESSLARQSERAAAKSALDRAAREAQALEDRNDDRGRAAREAARDAHRAAGGRPGGSGSGSGGDADHPCLSRYAQLPPHQPGCLYYPEPQFSSYLNPGALSRTRASALPVPPVTPDPVRNQPRCTNQKCKAPAIPNIRAVAPKAALPPAPGGKTVAIKETAASAAATAAAAAKPDVFVPRKADRSYRRWITNVKQLLKTDENKKIVIVEIGVGLGAGAGGDLRRVGEDLLALDDERIAMVRINSEFHKVTNREEQAVCIKDSALNALQRIHEYVEAEMDTIQTAVQPYYDKMAKMAGKGRR